MSEHDDNHHENAYDHIISQQSLSAADFKQHLTGPVIAFLLHIVIIPILLTVVVTEPRVEKNEIKVEAKVMEEVKIPEKPPEPPEPPEPEDIPQTEVEMDRPSTEVSEVEDVAPAETLVFDESPIEAPQVTMTTNNNSPKVLNILYSGRQGGKNGLVGRGGGGIGGQRSLKLGLDWLARNQNEDGSWGHGSGSSGEMPPALTALAMLSFFAHGETPSSVKYGKVVQKGCMKLIEYANRVDNRGVIVSDLHQYSHAIVTYALADGAAMTNIPQMIEAMNKSVASLIKGQNKEGSFYYNLKPTETSDMSFAGWCFQALKAAYAAGCKVEGLNEALDKSIKGIKVNQVKNGAFTYLSKNGRPEADKSRYANLTPVGVLCLQLLGKPKSEEVARGIKYITSEKDGALMELDWKTGKGYSSLEYAWRIYAWYYQTQVFFQNADGKKDEPNWRKWRTAFEKSLITEQEKEGYWSSPYQKYTAIQHGFSEAAGNKHGGVLGSEHNTRVYSTALCVMMLEVYYRFLPASQQGKTTTTKKSVSDDELLQF